MFRIRKLHTYPEIIKPIFFEDGLNIILGEKDESSNKTNGVGKSMSIEFINFCLLKKKDQSRVMKIPSQILHPDTQICLDIEINGKPITIIRTPKNADQPILIVNNVRTAFTNIDNTLAYLSDLFYTKSNINLNPSIRELINPSLRDERSEFKDIVSYFDTKKRIPPDHTPTLYLLDFDIAAYRLAITTIKDIDKLSNEIANLKKELTQNGFRPLDEVRAQVNSLDGELTKLELELEQLKTHDSYESVENDLLKLDHTITELREKQTYLKSSIQKIRSLPEVEKIDEEDVRFVYEQFIEGLGSQIKKSFDEVNAFKQKIEKFQNNIINERLKDLISQHKAVNKKIKTLDDERSSILKVFDREGVFKDLKQSIAVYHQKSEQSVHTRTSLKRYDANVKEKNNLQAQKSNLVTKIDNSIVDNEDKIRSFNKTISDICEYIMGNRGCSFNIKTVNRETYKDIVNFNMVIDYAGSHSIERMKVFIYDFALMINEYTSVRHPNFLIHDNIFDVDQDTLIKSLNFIYSIENLKSFQYILTLNYDKIADIESKKQLDFDIHDYSRAIFTKTNRFILAEKYSEIN
jgi:uncharacterized protein YydD (DUF2326 family)